MPFRITAACYIELLSRNHISLHSLDTQGRGQSSPLLLYPACMLLRVAVVVDAHEQEAIEFTCEDSLPNRYHLFYDAKVHNLFDFAKSFLLFLTCPTKFYVCLPLIHKLLDKIIGNYCFSKPQ